MAAAEYGRQGNQQYANVHYPGLHWQVCHQNDNRQRHENLNKGIDLARNTRLHLKTANTIVIQQCTADNDQIAAQNQCEQPKRNNTCDGQHQVSGDQQCFVSQRIGNGPKPGTPVKLPCQKAVQSISCGSKKENQQRLAIMPLQQCPRERNNEQYPQECQGIGNPSPTLQSHAQTSAVA